MLITAVVVLFISCASGSVRHGNRRSSVGGTA